MKTYSNNWLDIWCPVTGETVQITAQQAATTTGRTLSTARRWCSGAPVRAGDLFLLRARWLGLLHDPAWHRFRLRGGLLLDTDSGETWQPHNLRAALIAHGRASAMRAELDEYRHGRHQPREQIRLIR